MSELNKKSERLASAIYFVTGFFSDQEPLKWKLRDIVSEIVILSVSFIDDITDEKKQVVLESKRLILEIINLLNVARNANLISPANHELINGEFHKYLDGVASFSDFSGFFADEKVYIDKPVLKDFGTVLIKKNSRQSTIIAILKRKKEVMIKDISPIISGYSEKTIQRELLTMVKAGVLKKVGEKRWSRYSLA
ncbi:MAG: hypothetical protein Q8Q92_02155 [bacterium]|nr:hypothetical protein [bacterium]